MFNDFSNGLSETRETLGQGYFWDSKAVETRLSTGVRLAKHKIIREWGAFSPIGSNVENNQVMFLGKYGSRSILDYFAFTYQGQAYRYKTDTPASFPLYVNSFPSGQVVTDMVETPRGVYAFTEPTGSSSTSLTCKVYYIPKTTSGGAETLDVGLINSTPERITFTHNNTGNWHIKGKKFATLLDNQALMWTSYSSDGKTSIYLEDYEALLPLVSQAVSPVDTLPGICTGISTQGGTVYVYMTDRVFYYDIASLLQGRANELIPTGSISTDFKTYDVLSGTSADWVMTNNGVYQRSGLQFTLMSGVVAGLFRGWSYGSPLIEALSREEGEGNKLTTYGRKNNFFRGGFVGSEYIDGEIKTVYAYNDLYAYYRASDNKMILAQKTSQSGWLDVDMPGYYPLTENIDYLGEYCPTGSITSCRIQTNDLQQDLRLVALNVSFLLNSGRIQVEMRSNLNESWQEIGDYISSDFDSSGGAKITANQFPNRKFNWLQLRVTLSNLGNSSKSPIFYGITPEYEAMN